jgi:integrase
LRLGSRVGVGDDREGPINPKTKAGTKKVGIPGKLRLLLLEHKARCPWSGDPDGLVFGRTATDSFTPTRLGRAAKKAWAETNKELAKNNLLLLVPIGLHECRHTYVSLMFEAGLSLEQIGDLVGHSSAHMTEQYRHLLDDGRHVVEAVAKQDVYLNSYEAVSSRQARRNTVLIDAV